MREPPAREDRRSRGNSSGDIGSHGIGSEEGLRHRRVRSPWRPYGRARRFAVRGRQTQARRILAALRTKSEDVRLQALIANDLAVLAALDGRFEEAREGWQTALDLDSDCLPARLNRDLVQAQFDMVNQSPPNPSARARIGLREARLARVVWMPRSLARQFRMAGRRRL